MIDSLYKRLALASKQTILGCDFCSRALSLWMRPKSVFARVTSLFALFVYFPASLLSCVLFLSTFLQQITCTWNCLRLCLLGAFSRQCLTHYPACPSSSTLFLFPVTPSSLTSPPIMFSPTICCIEKVRGTLWKCEGEKNKRKTSRNCGEENKDRGVEEVHERGEMEPDTEGVWVKHIPQQQQNLWLWCDRKKFLCTVLSDTPF